MTITASTKFRELIDCGKIVQDSDLTTPQPEAERRFKRYVELVDSLTGTKGAEALIALFRSIQMQDDYGAYQRTLNAIFRFPPTLFGKVAVEELSRLIDKFPDWAGDILNTIAEPGDEHLQSLNKELECENSASGDKLLEFVRAQEISAWLEKSIGMIAPGRSK